jgi:hypothetical protein
VVGEDSKASLFRPDWQNLHWARYETNSNRRVVFPPPAAMERRD